MGISGAKANAASCRRGVFYKNGVFYWQRPSAICRIEISDPIVAKELLVFWPRCHPQNGSRLLEPRHSL